MEIRINGKMIDFTIENEKTIGEILGGMETECEQSGLTITGVSIDGNRIGADGLDEVFARDVDSASLIELETISGQHIRDMLKDMGASFTGHVESLRSIPVQLQTGNDLSVMETINAFSTDLQNLYRLIPLIPLTGLSNEQMMVGDNALIEFPDSIASLLSDLLEGMKSGDTILVGDLSEYELAPRIEELGTCLSGL